jgi:hypothetical protein
MLNSSLINLHGVTFYVSCVEDKDIRVEAEADAEATDLRLNHSVPLLVC